MCARLCYLYRLAGGILKRRGVALVVLGSLLWGTDSLFRRPLSRGLSPVTIVYLEHLVLSLVVLPWVVRARAEIARLEPRAWLSILFVAAGGSVFATSLFTYAIKYGNPSVTVLLQKTQPLWAILLARAVLSERPGGGFWHWVAPAIAGACFVSVPDWRNGLYFDLRQPLALAAALGAAALWGASTVLGRYATARVSTVPLTALRFLLALPILVVLYWLQPALERRLPSSPADAGMLVAMALGPGLAALLLYYRGLRSTIAPVASIAELAFPLTAVALNWIFLDIRLTPAQLAGGVLLLVSVTGLGYFGSGAERPEAPQGGPSIE